MERTSIVHVPDEAVGAAGSQRNAFVMGEVALGEQRHANDAIVGGASLVAEFDRLANMLSELIERGGTDRDLVGLLRDSSSHD